MAAESLGITKFVFIWQAQVMQMLFKKGATIQVEDGVENKVS